MDNYFVYNPISAPLFGRGDITAICRTKFRLETIHAIVVGNIRAVFVTMSCAVLQLNKLDNFPAVPRIAIYFYFLTMNVHSLNYAQSFAQPTCGLCNKETKKSLGSVIGKVMKRAFPEIGPAEKTDKSKNRCQSYAHHSVSFV